MAYSNNVYIELIELIKIGELASLRDFLLKHTDLDLTYHNDDNGFGQGKIFILSVIVDMECKQKEITELLLDYFEKMQLSKYKVDSAERNIVIYRLIRSLRIAIEDENISDEMKALLSKYICFKPDESDSSKDVEELEEIILEEIINEHESVGYTDKLDDRHSTSSFERKGPRAIAR